MPKKRKKIPWLKIALSSAIMVTVSVTVFKISCQKVQIAGQTTQQSSTGNNSPNISGNGAVNIINPPPAVPTRDFNQDENTAHQIYDDTKTPLDPPWESLSAKEKIEFIKLAPVYTGSQFKSLGQIINKTIIISAGGK